MAVQKKLTIIHPSQGPLSTRTIESQRKTFERAKGNGVYVKPNPLKAPCPVHKAEQFGHNGSTNVDYRLKAARERREEQQKIIASRELDRLEREQRAKQYYEQQLQDRKKKLLEQRLKEERRRAAVEEKRKQRMKEEKERYESAVRKTLEKSQKAQQSNQNRGRKSTKTNFPRHLPLTTWEKKLVDRLLTPTCAYLARSKSAGCQWSGGQVVHVCRRAVSCHSTSSPISTPHRPQSQPGRVQHRSSVSPGSKNLQTRIITVAQIKTAKLEDANNKKNRTNGYNAKFPAAKPSVQPASTRESRTASPSPECSPRKLIRRHSAPLTELPSVPEEDAGTCLEALPTPDNTRSVRMSAEGHAQRPGDTSPLETPRSNLPVILEAQETSRTHGDGSPSQLPPAPQPPELTSKPTAGTTDREEASRILAEKRREARLQREREEQERLQREDAQWRSHEDLECRRAEEQARLQAEDQRLMEEKRKREEEEQRRAEEERAQAIREAQLLQKQRVEEQAKERARAEQLRQERELLAQKEETERQARKKRLEEIMQRTRRADSPDRKTTAVRISVSGQPKENTQPLKSGTIEDAVKIETKTSSLGLNSDDESVPVVAFKERRSLRTLTGLEEIQTQQRAEVI